MKFCIQKSPYVDDVLVTVDWKLGWYFYVFGQPKSRVLSIKNGEITYPGRMLDPLIDPPVAGWVSALQELADATTIVPECKDRTPHTLLKLPQCNPTDGVHWTKRTPKSKLPKMGRGTKHKKRRLIAPESNGETSLQDTNTGDYEASCSMSSLQDYPNGGLQEDACMPEAP